MGIEVSDWHGCYSEGWGGHLVSAAFAHPAKVSYKLSERIYDHIVDQGWVKQGDTILDPFGGIAGFGFHAMVNGLNFVGVELEQRFVDLGRENIEMWNKRYSGLPRWGSAQILEGDSRRLGEIVQGAGCIVSSPPYASDIMSPAHGIDWSKAKEGSKNGSIARDSLCHTYGSTDGQLGAMPAGDFGAVVSSPPYEGMPVAHIDSGVNMGEMWRNTGESLRKQHGEKLESEQYNLANPANLGAGADFWTAAHAIVSECYAVLHPGGVAIWVVKAFVRNKQRVDFPDQWRQLCESVGFTTLHEHRAWVVEDYSEQMTLDGDIQKKQVSRKSFFRRLAESKGSPSIDWETVLCMVKEE